MAAHLDSRPRDSTTEAKRRLSICIEEFKRVPNAVLTLLKFKFTNGDDACSFTKAYCKYDEAPVSFEFLEVFQIGMVRLVDYLVKGDDGSFSQEWLAAFKCLIETFSQIDSIEESLKKDVGKQGTAVGVQLAHHLLSPLCSNKNYSLDCYQRNPIYHCKCCGETISGSYSDTSIGNDTVWHGRLDLLMNDVPVAVDHSAGDSEDTKEDETDSNDFPASSVEVKETHQNQLFAETIVFAFLQHRLQRSARVCLIPTIAISKTNMLINFYDPVNDFFVSSSLIYLFNTKNEIDEAAVLALWLVLNYTLTCSGLTDNMVRDNYKADFLKNFDDKVKTKYKRNMKFGVHSIGSTTNTDQYIRNMYKRRLRSDYGKPIAGFPSFKKEKIDYPF